MKRLLTWLVISVSILLTGCAGRDEFEPPEPNDKAFAPPALDYSVPSSENGSLYRHKYNMTLFRDRKEFRVGDMLTVQLNEKTASKKSADTQYGKSSGVGFGVPEILGQSIDNLSASIDADRDFNGSSASSQGNQLTGAITVIVQKVLPNGVLMVSGEKWIRLNQGDEFIRVTGMVRQDDVDRLNKVSSQRIGDARITYAGRGALADSNASGWLTQFFNSPWMPF